MKKALIITTLVYEVAYIGLAIYALKNPEKYGEWNAKFIGSMTSTLEKLGL